MRITRVTISGADDEVDPSDLVEIGRGFPFVEWGILHSVSRRGTPRYPSADWLCEIERVANPGLQLAAHLCGKNARDVLSGNDDWFDFGNGQCPYNRVQINGFSSASDDPNGVRFVVDQHREAEFICQATGDWGLRAADRLAARLPNVSVLWDLSGGRGMGLDLSRFWVPTTLRRFGFAGGIGPENIVHTLEMLSKRVGEAEVWVDSESHIRRDDRFEVWVDMESGVRIDDRFDLGKVRSVLEQARPFMARMESP